MNVKELAEALQSLPEEVQEWKVITEGCDCEGDAGNVQVYKETKEVIIGRGMADMSDEGSVRYIPSDEEVAAFRKGLLPPGGSQTLQSQGLLQ